MGGISYTAYDIPYMSDSICDQYDLDFEKRMENDELPKKNRTIKFGMIPNKRHVRLLTNIVLSVQMKS